jgi:hypothetical protein
MPELRRFYEPVVALSFVTSPEHKLGLGSWTIRVLTRRPT